MTVIQSRHTYARTNFAGVAMNVGVKRERQEDAAEIGEFFLIVADGMGGQPDGEKASCAAVQAVAKTLNAAGPDNVSPELIREAFAAAQDAVGSIPRISDHPAYWPATTLLVAVSDGQGGIIGGHLGDSRVYGWSEESGLVQLTVDHESPNGAVTRFVGGSSDTPDIFTVTPEFEDRTSKVVVLCTDGLFLDVSDHEIEETIRTQARTHIQADSLAITLADAAVVNGGRDNVTVGVLFL